MKLTIVLKKTKTLNARISELAKDLIALEMSVTNESEGEIVERLVIQGIRSPDACKLIRKYAAEDPTMVAIIDAIQAFSRIGKPPNKRGRKGSGAKVEGE